MAKPAEVRASVVGVLNANGGQMEYPALLEAIDPLSHRQLPQALRRARLEGELYQWIDGRGGGSKHIVSLTPFAE